MCHFWIPCAAKRSFPTTFQTTEGILGKVFKFSSRRGSDLKLASCVQLVIRQSNY